MHYLKATACIMYKLLHVSLPLLKGLGFHEININCFSQRGRAHNG